MNIIGNWNDGIDKNNADFKDALAALKEGKTKVGDKEMSHKFDKLSKFTDGVINYFQDDLQPKLTIKIRNETVFIEKIKTN